MLTDKHTQVNAYIPMTKRRFAHKQAYIHICHAHTHTRNKQTHIYTLDDVEFRVVLLLVGDLCISASI
jgi:hypothetical protein